MNSVCVRVCERASVCVRWCIVNYVWVRNITQQKLKKKKRKKQIKLNTRKKWNKRQQKLYRWKATIFKSVLIDQSHAEHIIQYNYKVIVWHFSVFISKNQKKKLIIKLHTFAGSALQQNCRNRLQRLLLSLFFLFALFKWRIVLSISAKSVQSASYYAAHGESNVSALIRFYSYNKKGQQQGDRSAQHTKFNCISETKIQQNHIKMGEHDFKLNVDSLIERLLEGECNLAFHCQANKNNILREEKNAIFRSIFLQAICYAQ